MTIYLGPPGPVEEGEAEQVLSRLRTWLSDSAETGRYRDTIGMNYVQVRALLIYIDLLEDGTN